MCKNKTLGLEEFLLIALNPHTLLYHLDKPLSKLTILRYGAKIEKIDHLKNIQYDKK